MNDECNGCGIKQKWSTLRYNQGLIEMAKDHETSVKIASECVEI
jgi:hypothetical protein